MGLFDGKRGLIVGVANDRSIAWAIAEEIMRQGGVCGFTNLPDKPDDEKKKNLRRVTKCTDQYPDQTKFVVPLDVQKDDQIAQVMSTVREQFGKIDFLVHSIAFASLEDLAKPTIACSREGFKMAMDISAYSLLALCNAAKELFEPDAAVLAMTYFGGEKIVPGYNVMGICKAALDAAVGYAAFDLGLQGVRVNAISAGPLKTLASSAVKANDMEKLYEQISPMNRNITHVDVANTAAFLLSPMARGITAEIIHVDAGYNAMGSPGRMLEKLKEAKA